MACRLGLLSLLFVALAVSAHGLGAVEHASSSIKKDKDSNEFVIIISSTLKTPSLKWETDDRTIFCKEKPTKSYTHENIWRVVMRWECYSRFGKYLSECPTLQQTDPLTPSFKLIAHTDSNEQSFFSCANVQDFSYEGAYPPPNTFLIAGASVGLLVIVLLLIVSRRSCRKSKKSKSSSKKKQKKKAEKEKEKKKLKAKVKKSLLKDDYLSNGVDLDYYNVEDDYDYKPYLGGRSAKRRPDSHRRSKYSSYF